MEWSKDLYDNFKLKTDFGNISEKQTIEEVNFLCDVLQLPLKSKVLDLCCGTGRHSIELDKRGYFVTGIDFNSNYLSFAKSLAMKNNLNPSFVQGDIRYVDYGKDYDAVISMFHSFGFFDDKEDYHILRKIYDSLKIQGKFFLEILNRDWIIRNFLKYQELEIGGVLVKEEREFDVLTSRSNFLVQRCKENEIIEKKGSWRLYSAHEIKNMLENLGFKFMAGYGSLDNTPLTLDSTFIRAVFVK